MDENLSNPQLDAARLRLERLAKKWNKLLGIQHLGIDITHKYIPSYHEEDHLILATTEAVWQYRYASIQWYLPAIARATDLDLEDAMVHEYVHALISPMESKLSADYTEFCEFSVESLARAIRSLYARTEK